MTEINDNLETRVREAEIKALNATRITCYAWATTAIAMTAFIVSAMVGLW